MNKFYGLVGFEESVETEQDVTEPVITWRSYFGDIVKFKKSFKSGEKVNEDITLNNTISIMSDSYAYNHLSNVRCVKWLGSIWKVTDVDAQYPRLNLTLGGLYNVEDPETGTEQQAQGNTGD